MELTKDRQLALTEVRKAMYERLQNFSFTPEMLQDKSPYQMLCMLQLLLGHRNYFPMFSDTVVALREIFGDTFFDKSQPEEQSGSKTKGSKAEVVH